MRCRICKTYREESEEGTLSFVCGNCIQKKCLETYPYEEFKPKEIKANKKTKKRARKSRDELAKEKIKRWNNRLKKRRTK